MESVRTFIELGTRFEALVDGEDPTEAKQLLEWVRAEGLQTLKLGLEAFLAEKSKPLGLLNIPALHKAQAKKELVPIEPGDEACVAPILKGWTVGKHIDAGAYELDRMPTNHETTEEKRVLKVIRSNEDIGDEIKHTQIASTLGIGPYLNGSVECKGENGVTRYMVLDFLTGPLLIDVYFKNADYVKTALSLYYDLAVQGGIFHGDLHGYNVMFNGARMYLVDFGYANPVTGTLKDELYSEMFEAADELVTSLLNHHKSKTAIRTLTDIKERTRRWLMVNKAAHEWLQKTFPERESTKILFSTEITADNGESLIDWEDPAVVAYSA
ncbi:Hypothetical protein POVN_LOCUS279 [uncultured virus]|nr:Hypothetical protein POVN_LOCUS279 [uncultured virus]